MIIYALTIITCAVIKIIMEKVNENKIGGESPPPKIYYVTPTKKRKEKPSVIPIKASVIEKENINE